MFSWPSGDGAWALVNKVCCAKYLKLNMDTSLTSDEGGKWLRSQFGGKIFVKVTGDVDVERWFKNHSVWNVGDREHMGIWHHRWLGNQSLVERYPRIFSNFENKNAKIKEVGAWYDGRWNWKLGWRRQWFSWEESILHSFLEDK